MKGIIMIGYSVSRKMGISMVVTVIEHVLLSYGMHRGGQTGFKMGLRLLFMLTYRVASVKHNAERECVGEHEEREKEEKHDAGARPPLQRSIKEDAATA